MTDRAKTTEFDRRYWGKLNARRLKCAKGCKQSALAEILDCRYTPASNPTS